MRNSFFGMMMSLVFFLLIQYLVRYALILLGFEGLWLFIVFDLIIAFVFAYFTYPSMYRKQALKDPRFHMSFAMYFGLLVLFDVIF